MDYEFNGNKQTNVAMYPHSYSYAIDVLRLDHNIRTGKEAERKTLASNAHSCSHFRKKTTLGSVLAA